MHQANIENPRAFPNHINTDLREWIVRQGTQVQKEWLRLHDAARPSGLREKLKPEIHRARLEAEDLASYWMGQRTGSTKKRSALPTADRIEAFPGTRG